MTGMSLSFTGASSLSNGSWDTIEWPPFTKEVRRLQMRIAKAVREKRYGKVKALQWLLTHSYSAKLLAVKRVTSNSGSRTPGVDGVLWRTPLQKMKAVESLKRRGYKPQPLKRIYISKKSGGKRPLSIPTLQCRAMQALHLLALEPVAEMRADKNAYGFRSKRSVADAIGQCFNALAQKTASQWVLEGDIRSCFDSLCGSWLQENIPMDTVLLTKWITAGYIKDKTLYSTFDGVPQGGIISPTILVLALSGLEARLKKATSLKDKVNMISYADDFVVTGVSKELLEQKVKPLVQDFLRERGLELSNKKAQITHIDTGFDFLGFNVRKYKGTLLIKPSKENIKGFLSRIRKLIKSQATIKTENLLYQLNPKLRGWANYYRHVCSKKSFVYVDTFVFKTLMQWAKRRHPKKGTKWICDKYFRSQGLRNWIFSTRIKDKEGNIIFLDLYKTVHMPIRRHVKIKGEATPYDPQYKEYFLKRNRSKKTFSSENRKRKPRHSSLRSEHPGK